MTLSTRVALVLGAALLAGNGAAGDEPDPQGAKAAPPHGDRPPGISLGADIRLHARFDMAYERHSYTEDPSDGKDAFRNYHRFVFLTRHAKGDPFFFNAELVGLTFYEVGYQLPLHLDTPLRLSFALGKILVPFGAEPLYHHAYGGRTGFDQRFLPVVWADFGVKGTLDVDLDPVRLRVDAYVLRGYTVRAPEDEVSLQANAAPLDDLEFSGGGRISASLGAASVYYSVYGSQMDFGQSLLVQAFDLSVYRIPNIPFLEDLAVSFGVVRADVWRSGEPDYYHFADYVEVRYFLYDTLYLQYRGGLDMRDNHTGAFADPDRLDRFDTSAHSVALGWSHRGFSLVLQHLWQLELVDEQPDDLLRLTAAYEF